MKPNPLLAKLELQHAAQLRLARLYMRQETIDIAMDALNRIEGYGPERNKRFLDVFNAACEEHADLWDADADDKEREYAKAKFEERMKAICGKYYAPREVRYDFS